MKCCRVTFMFPFCSHPAIERFAANRGKDTRSRSRGRRKAMIDRDWPHQVALPTYRCLGHNYLTIQFFCEGEGLSLCPRTHSLRRGDQDMLVYCFAQRQHAEQFRERFGGELIDPKSRPKRTAARKSACAHAIDVRESAASAKHQRALYPAQFIERFGADCLAIELREHLLCSTCRGRMANLHESTR